MSKLIRYLSNSSNRGIESQEMHEKTLQLYSYFGKQLIQTINERQISLADVDLDDPLIDLELHDIVDIVRLYSVLAKPPQSDELSSIDTIPRLFEDGEQPQFQEEFTHSEQAYLQLYRPEHPDSISNIHELSQFILGLLRDPISKKLQKEDGGAAAVTIANIGDLMLCYGAVVSNVPSLASKRQFLHDLENAANDRLLLKDKFTTIASTNYLWGYAKFLNRKVNPYFNADPASCLLNRY